ncbi:MAG: 30S ribosomal protein S8 [Firmicutes bacterium]|nr:30S ribosomal protein S8 [Bacillota bacterium]
MRSTDVIADFITRIRNASSVGHEFVEIPSSKMKKSMAKILVNEGYIKKFIQINNEKQGILKIILRYKENKTPVISCLKRISKPGLRVYSKSKLLPKVLNGLGVAVVSTSKGIMSDRNARSKKLGGEVLFFVY